MKTLLLSLLALASCTFANEKELSLDSIGEVLSGINELSLLVIKVNPGDEIPLQFRLEGDILELETPPENGKMKAIKPLYIKVEPHFLFSEDKEEWKSFESYFTGMLGVLLVENTPPTGEIYLDLHKR